MPDPDFTERNPAFVTKQAHKLLEVRRAMYKFRKANKVCAWCTGRTKLDVHHITPVSVAPHLAGVESNMMMLCRKNDCHRVIGHGGNFRNKYVTNARDLCNFRSIVGTTKHRGAVT